jgi:hypothetical protein
MDHTGQNEPHKIQILSPRPQRKPAIARKIAGFFMPKMLFTL